MARAKALLVAAILTAAVLPAGAAESVMVQCGREYQAARSAGTLNGADWTSFRVACAERLKATPAAAAAPPPATAAVQASPAGTAAPAPSVTAAAPASAPAKTPSAGMAAMHARQKQCGAEWTSGKATLVAQTPDLTWPKYWSQCNTRIKTTGR